MHGTIVTCLHTRRGSCDKNWRKIYFFFEIFFIINTYIICNIYNIFVFIYNFNDLRNSKSLFSIHQFN